MQLLGDLPLESRATAIKPDTAQRSQDFPKVNKLALLAALLAPFSSDQAIRFTISDLVKQRYAVGLCP